MSCGSRTQMSWWTRREGAGDQVVVCGPPHRARRLLLTPPCRAFGTVASLVGLVRRKQSAPPLGKPGKLRARYRQQGGSVSACGQLGEHVEPFPHSVAQYLAQYLIHEPSPLPLRLAGSFSQHCLQLADLGSRQHGRFSRRPDKDDAVLIHEHRHDPAPVCDVVAVDPPPASAIGRLGPLLYGCGVVSRFRLPGGEDGPIDQLHGCGSSHTCSLLEHKVATWGTSMGKLRADRFDSHDERSSDFGRADQTHRSPLHQRGPCAYPATDARRTVRGRN
jgi:hypothetical protein